MTDSPLEGQATDLRGKRVVICEDEAMTMMHIARALTKAGLEVVDAAADGAEALKTIKKHNPDIVTMDVHMPHMNGIETIRRITRDAAMCILVVSAYSSEETQREAMEAGACGFISKPVIGDDVVRAVEEAYRVYQARHSLVGAAP